MHDVPAPTTYKAKLAEIYDAIYEFKDYPKASDYLLTQIRQHHPSARTLLEVACGTGKYLEILRRHYDVQGLDASAEMLEKAASRLEGIPLHHADMVDFSLPDRFDVVCCLFRSIAYVRNIENFYSAIKAMARHVSPGGILVIEPFFTPKTFWADTITLNEHKSPQLQIAWMYTSKRVGSCAELNIHYLVGTPDGIDHFTEAHNLGLFDAEDYRRAFEDAGLQLIYDEKGPTGVGLYLGKKALEPSA
jgi:ubiquinone/menaquinone biosynthesis C-methylase UbiE